MAENEAWPKSKFDGSRLKFGRDIDNARLGPDIIDEIKNPTVGMLRPRRSLLHDCDRNQRSAMNREISIEQDAGENIEWVLVEIADRAQLPRSAAGADPPRLVPIRRALI